MFVVTAFQELMPSKRLTAMRMTWSASKKKIDAMKTMTNTMMVVTVVSLRVGQVTFCPSARTSCRNLKGLIRAIAESKNHSPPEFKDETDQRFLLGITFAAEVRYRAACDGAYLLPARRSVKTEGGNKLKHLPACRSIFGPGRSGGTRTPNPRFWRPVL
jgi:hypothetical protein